VVWFVVARVRRVRRVRREAAAAPEQTRERAGA
jgi:hypothetical protein